MKIWNFAHGIMHMHVYELLAIALLAAMVVIAIVNRTKQKKSEEPEAALNDSIPEAMMNGEDLK